MSWISNKLQSWLAETLEISASDIDQCFSPSRNPKEGDYTLASFPLAKALKKKPPEITADWVSTLQGCENKPPLTESFTAKGPYLNFMLDGASVAEGLLAEIFSKGDQWGHNQEHQGKKI